MKLWPSPLYTVDSALPFTFDIRLMVTEEASGEAVQRSVAVPLPVVAVRPLTLGGVSSYLKETDCEAELPAATYSKGTEVAQTPAPAETPAATPAATPAPYTPQATTLPKTASSYPLIGLLGLLSLGAFFTLRAIRAS